MRIESALLVSLLSILLLACDKAKEPPIVPPPLPPMPSTGSLANLVNKHYNADIINFDGFGPAKFGSNEESVRMSWGRPLNASKPAIGATCYYLYMDKLPEHQQGIAFMLEDGQFVRYDVGDTKQVAPGNIVVGDSATSVLQAHAGHVENLPHKYIQGAHTLVVTPVEQTNARLIFETDANDTIVNWRIGVPPQIYYVEGCS
ncbi:MAG TPA: hypothetical protein VK967_05145 [Methylotenera sp.]|nr:hypothetical protein [Methylotenera sp.]